MCVLEGTNTDCESSHRVRVLVDRQRPALLLEIKLSVENEHCDGDARTHVATFTSSA